MRGGDVWELAPACYVFHPSKGDANPRAALREVKARVAVDRARSEALLRDARNASTLEATDRLDREKAALLAATAPAGEENNKGLRASA